MKILTKAWRCIITKKWKTGLCALMLIIVIGDSVGRLYEYMRLRNTRSWSEIDKLKIRLLAGKVYKQFDMKETERRRMRRTEIINSITSKKNKSRTPDVITIGARKCGTGPFRKFLEQHPLIRSAHHEIHYYDGVNHTLGIEYYKSVLPNATSDELIFEKTPAYFMTGPVDLPQKIKQQCPGVKVILLLCEPVKRALSDFAMRVRRKQALSNLSFEDFVSDVLPKVEKLVEVYNVERNLSVLLRESTNGILRTFTTGLYSVYLKRWIDTFTFDNLLVLNGDYFLRNPGKVIEKVQRFLSLPNILITEDFVKHPTTGLACLRPWWENYNFEAELFNVSGWDQNLICLKGKGYTRAKSSNASLSAEVSRQLRTFYDPFNKELWGQIGHAFDWYT